MPPIFTDRFAADILGTARGTRSLSSDTDIISSDTTLALAVGTPKSDNNNANTLLTQSSLPSTPLPHNHNLIPRSSSSNSSTTIGIVLGSIAGFLVVLTIIYVCYFRHYSTMYIVSRSSSATSSKASQRSRRRRRRSRRQPILAGLPRPREVFIVDVMRTRGPVAVSVSGGDGGTAATEPAAEAPAEAAAVAAAAAE